MPFHGLFAAEGVEIGESSLRRDGQEVGYLFGAEVQYFRARGGSGRNVPKADVDRLWNKLLDRVVEAGMNTVTLYIPWDFHEPVEGIFDFDGTLDQDHDGLPDYPSRNINEFLRLVEHHGLKNIMVRPGPYINAEWGPEGFGAVPRWFLDQYPEALTGTLTPGKPRTVSFAHPKFRELATRWMQMLHAKVLKDFIGPGKLIAFVQIDNESNYFWDSIYERDLSVTGRSRYAQFLANTYANDLSALNAVYKAHVKSFSEVEPPSSPNDLRYAPERWQYDWGHFHDAELLDYYQFLRGVWESLGVSEPQVLFTSCDSFNAPENGLLPRLDYRQGHKLTLTTMNIYPKTYGTQAQSTMNTPMKAAHDATLIAASHRQYYGTAGEWLMSTETVGGWFPPVEVSLATREHTYGSLLGAGVKAMNIYYFHEGWNWTGLERDDSELHFDAPLNKDMEPTPSFYLLKNLGKTLKKDLGPLMMATKTVHTPVLIAHDSNAQYRAAGAEDVLKISSTDSAALFGLFREAGASPDVAFIDAMTKDELQEFRLVIWHHPGYISQRTRSLLEGYVALGGTLLAVGDVKFSNSGSGRVISLASNPADGWNGDDYAHLPTATATLAWAKQLVKGLGLHSALDVSALDGKASLHGTLRAGASSSLIFLENFMPQSRLAHIQIRSDFLPPAKGFKLQQLLTADHLASLALPIIVTREELELIGTTLPVSRDGVDIWELSRVE